MYINTISTSILLFFAVLCPAASPPTRAKALPHPLLPHPKDRRSQREPTPTDLAKLIHELRANGVEVGLSKEKISQPFFSTRGRIIDVNNQAVWVFSYANARAAKKDAAKISRDGMTIGSSKPAWLGTPHFYRRLRLIVLYLGDDSRVLNALTRVIGQQFAGG